MVAEAVNEDMITDYETYVRHKRSFNGTLNGIALPAPAGVSLYEEVNNLVET